MTALKPLVVLSILLASLFQTQAQEPMQFTIDHYAINVVNLERSVAFYQDIFGLQEIKNGTGLSHIRWFRLGNSQELHIIEVDSLDKKIPKGVHLALAVDDFDRFRESANSKEINYSDWPGTPKAISTRSDNIRQLYFQDPDGYWIEVNDAKQF
ncbi:glyoxalase [Dokdonia sinensis]|uniref:Glyoxalase n=1 Tax=Dokdonia sinensis TaxID=2479847 RepID=A0A3M0FTR1_9FLAO|nr:VOC family protein [Dokdonia sinensis]RMB56074.1 glyoxalase [Dokdonia sinensis]